MSAANVNVRKSGDGDEKEYQSPAAADYLDTSEGTLRAWRHLGKGPVYYKSAAGDVFYKKSDLDAFKETRKPRRIVPGERRSAA